MRTWRTYNCDVCGQETRRRRDPQQARVCVECGIKRSGDNARRMAAGDRSAMERQVTPLLRRLIRDYPDLAEREFARAAAGGKGT